MSIRYFRYVSKQKVDDAFSQITPSMFERLSVELNSAFLPISVSADNKPRVEDLEAKVEVVEAALRAEGQVGTIGAPNQWFAGTMEMHCGFFGSDADGNPEVVFFIGMFADVLVALGGSAHNVRRSGWPEQPRPYSNSGWETMMQALHKESRRITGGEALRPPSAIEVVRRMKPDERFEEPLTNPVYDTVWSPVLPSNAGAWPAEAREVLTSFSGRGRAVEFVARFGDVSDPLTEPPAILGSPLYVAEAPGVPTVEQDPAPKRRLLPFGRRKK